MDTTIRELKRKNLPIVIALCFAAFMASLDGYIVNISLPAIAQYYQVDMNSVSNVVVVYLLFLVGTMLIAGKLADRIGLRSFLFYGYLVFVGGSLFCGLSTSLWMLIISRAIQGVGAAIMTVAAYAVIAKKLPPSITGWGFGLLASSAAVGLTIGSPLGGFITENLSWHWIFLINVPVGIIAAFFTYKMSPGSKSEPQRQPDKGFDIAGSLISFLTIALTAYVLSQGNDLGWMSLQTILLSVLILFFFVSLLIVEKKAEFPVFDLSLFNNRIFTLAMLSTVFVFLFLAGNLFLMPFYLTSCSGLSTQNAGLVLMIYSAVYMISGPLAGKASDSIKPEKLCMLAALGNGLGCILFAVFLDTPSLLPVIVLQVWFGIFNGLFISPNSNLVMSSAAKGQRGAVSGLFSTISRLSMMIGVVIFESIFSAGADLENGENLISSMAHQVMADGFQVAYYTGAGLFFLGFVFCLIISRTKTDIDSWSTSSEPSTPVSYQ